MQVRVMAVDRYRNPLKATSPSDTSTWQVRGDLHITPPEFAGSLIFIFLV